MQYTLTTQACCLEVRHNSQLDAMPSFVAQICLQHDVGQCRVSCALQQHAISPTAALPSPFATPVSSSLLLDLRQRSS